MIWRGGGGSVAGGAFIRQHRRSVFKSSLPCSHPGPPSPSASQSLPLALLPNRVSGLWAMVARNGSDLFFLEALLSWGGGLASSPCPRSVGVTLGRRALPRSVVVFQSPVAVDTAAPCCTRGCVCERGVIPRVSWRLGLSRGGGGKQPVCTVSFWVTNRLLTALLLASGCFCQTWVFPLSGVAAWGEMGSPLEVRSLRTFPSSSPFWELPEEPQGGLLCLPPRPALLASPLLTACAEQLSGIWAESPPPLSPVL